MSDVRRLPEPPDGQRVETGPTQFGGDWTGIFIRGDQALYLAAMLAGIPEPKYDWLAATVLSNLRKLLASCEHRAPSPTPTEDTSPGMRETPENAKDG